MAYRLVLSSVFVVRCESILLRVVSLKTEVSRLKKKKKANSVLLMIGLSVHCPPTVNRCLCLVFLLLTELTALSVIVTFILKFLAFYQGSE
jgi:hypothetical protein